MSLTFDPNELAVGGSHRTLAERAFAVLHQAIVTGVLTPGERLPIEDLAQTLDMSPMPIREALRRLDAVGLVENIPHRGARVTELSATDLEQIYEARLALEPLAIRRAATSFSEEAAVKAQRELDVYRTALHNRDELKSLEAHTRFHFALYAQSGSGWLVRLITPLWESSERYRLSLPVAPMEKRLGEHDRILSACVSREPDVAAAELHNHLARTANAVAKLVGDGPLFSLVTVPPRRKSEQRSRARKGAAA